MEHPQFSSAVALDVVEILDLRGTNPKDKRGKINVCEIKIADLCIQRIEAQRVLVLKREGLWIFMKEDEKLVLVFFFTLIPMDSARVQSLPTD